MLAGMGEPSGKERGQEANGGEQGGKLQQQEQEERAGAKGKQQGSNNSKSRTSKLIGGTAKPGQIT